MQESRSIRLLALDFDGVIVDSVLECAVVAYNGYHAFQGKGSRIKSPQEIPADTLSKFRLLRPYIRSGEDYLYLFQALDEDRIIDNQSGFDKYHDTYLDRKESYYQLFYAERSWLLETNKPSWLKLNPLFPNMAEFLKSFDPDNIYIITTKAILYVVEILQANGITLKSDHLYQAVDGVTKSEIIVSILTKYSIPAAQFHFIDDHPLTVLDAVATGVNRFLAGWGYNTELQRKEVSDNGIPVLRIEDLFSLSMAD